MLIRLQRPYLSHHVCKIHVHIVFILAYFVNFGDGHAWTTYFDQIDLEYPGTKISLASAPWPPPSTAARYNKSDNNYLNGSGQADGSAPERNSDRAQKPPRSHSLTAIDGHGSSIENDNIVSSTPDLADDAEVLAVTLVREARHGSAASSSAAAGSSSGVSLEACPHHGPNRNIVAHRVLASADSPPASGVASGLGRGDAAHPVPRLTPEHSGPRSLACH